FHGKTFTQHLTIKGDPREYLDFMEQVLAQAERVKANLRGEAGETAAVRAPALPPPSPSRSGGGAVLNCSSCGAEYRLPPGSAGKKFRCSSCKAVLQAPADMG